MTALGKRVEWKSAGSHSVKMGHLENWKAFSKLISQNDKNSKSQEKRLKTLFPQVWEFAGLETRSDEEGIEMKHRNKLQTLNCCRYLGFGYLKTSIIVQHEFVNRLLRRTCAQFFLSKSNTLQSISISMQKTGVFWNTFCKINLSPTAAIWGSIWGRL